MSCILAPNKEMLVLLLRFCLGAHRFCLCGYSIMSYAELTLLTLACTHQSFAYAAPFQGASSQTWTQFRTRLMWQWKQIKIDDGNRMLYSCIRSLTILNLYRHHFDHLCLEKGSPGWHWNVNQLRLFLTSSDFEALIRPQLASLLPCSVQMVTASMSVSSRAEEKALASSLRCSVHGFREGPLYQVHIVFFTSRYTWVQTCKFQWCMTLQNCCCTFPSLPKRGAWHRHLSYHPKKGTSESASTSVGPWARWKTTKTKTYRASLATHFFWWERSKHSRQQK